MLPFVEVAGVVKKRLQLRRFRNRYDRVAGTGLGSVFGHDPPEPIGMMRAPDVVN
jgi:hypothetical protein